MFNFLRKLNFIQWYSMAMITWFTWGRVLALSNTDNVAVAFLHNPFTFIIAIITVVYAIIVLAKNIIPDYDDAKLSQKIMYYDISIYGVGLFLLLVHTKFMLFRGSVFFNNHSIVDFGYLILDIWIVLYFIASFIICRKPQFNKINA